MAGVLFDGEPRAWEPTPPTEGCTCGPVACRTEGRSVAEQNSFRGSVGGYLTYLTYQTHQTHLTHQTYLTYLTY